MLQVTAVMLLLQSLTDRPRHADCVVMAAAQRAWNNEVRQMMRCMEAAVNQVASISFPTTTLRIQTPLVEKLEPAMTRIYVLLFTLHDPGLVIRPEYALFVTDFTALLSQLVPQLTRLGLRLSLPAACIAFTAAAEQKLFWTLWQYLLAASTAFRTATARERDDIPTQPQPFHAPLYAAFQSLLKWLLVMSRSPAWVMMKNEHGLQGRNHDLVTILTPPLISLVHLSERAAQPALDSHLKILPPTLLGLMCCITSENFGSAPAIVPQARLMATFQAINYPTCVFTTESGTRRGALLTHLTSSINNLADSSQTAGFPMNLAFLLTPAVIQFLKMFIIWTTGINNNIFRVQLSMHVLLALFERQWLHSMVKDQRMAFASQPNIDAAGLPMHLNPLFSKPALQTDAMLLHVLSIHIHQHPTLTAHLHHLQHDIVQSWLCALIKYPQRTAGVVSVMFHSINGLAKHCTAFALQHLRQLAGEGVLQQPKSGGQKFKKDQKQYHQAARSQPLDLGIAGLEDERQVALKWIRLFTYVTSEIQMDIMRSLGTGGLRTCI